MMVRVVELGFGSGLEIFIVVSMVEEAARELGGG
jgi:hypothetical protein